MAVAYDAFTESHATGGSASEASFSWSHNPVGTPKGVLVFVCTNANADYITSVTYDGVNVPQVSGGEAADTATEPGRTTAFFLGSSVPTTDPATVVVNRTNNATVLWAVSITVTASSDTAVYTAGIVLLQENQAPAEKNVDDGSPGSNSVRFAGINYGRSAASIAAGANSTMLATQNHASTSRSTAVCRETTAGQGSRPVGFTGVSDDCAAVHLAVYEAAAAAGIPSLVMAPPVPA